MNATRFPTLLSKDIKLSFTNFRKWKSRITAPNGKIDWNNKQALLDRYARGRIAEYGDPRFWRLFNILFMNRNHLQISQAYLKAAAVVRKKDPLALIPDEHQVRYRVDQLDPFAVNLARYGKAYAEQNMLDYIERDWDDVAANEIWVGDHRVSDLPIKVWNEKEQCWEPEKPWMCVWMDSKSWYVIAVNIDMQEMNNEDIRNAFAAGVSEYGLPDAICTDNGKDFKKQGFTEPVKFDEYEYSIVKSLNVKVKRAKPFNGRTKLVERFFKYVSDQYDRMFAPYLGNTPSARPEAAKLYYKKEYAHLLMTLEEFTQEFYKFIDQYHDTPHEGKMLDGMTPREAFAPEKRFVRAQKTRDELAYAFLLPEPSLRTVSRGPAITFDNKRYKGDCLYHYIKRAESKTAPKLMIKTDMINRDHLYVYEPGGKLVGECRTDKFVPANVKTDEGRALLEEQLKHNPQSMRRGNTLIINLTGGYHLLAPHDVLQLPLETLAEDAKLEKVAGITQVKGDHTYSHYQVKGAARKQLSEAPVRESEPVDDPKRAKRLEIQAKLDATLLKGKSASEKPKLKLAEDIKPPEIKEKLVLKD